MLKNSVSDDRCRLCDQVVDNFAVDVGQPEVTATVTIGQVAVIDAELVEKVWGDDLRVEGVAVEYLGGVDDLADHLRDFRPGPGRRVGVLVDHLVAGSKESRIAQGIARSAVGKHVLIVGHPFVDIWQAVKPDRLGLEAWPTIPRSIEWKKGVCQHLGWPHRDQADIARAWKQVLGRVGSFADLEPALLGRVEELIDFVTADQGDR